MINTLQNKNKQTGQAMVEMVVVMFVTLLILFAVIHFGFIYNAKTVLNYATHEAARAGSLNYGSPRAMRSHAALLHLKPQRVGLATTIAFNNHKAL